jgi:hypothetical protein
MLRILEISWLILALSSLTAGIYKWFQEGFTFSFWFFICALVATVAWIIRRKQRISLQNSK